MSTPIVETIAPLNAPAPVAPVATPAAKPAEQPALSPKQSRSAAIRAAIAAMPADEASDTEAPEAKAEPVAPVETKPAEEPAKAPETGKAKAWADAIEMQRKAREERESVKAEREAVKAEREKLKEQTEAARLLSEDPIAFAAKYGGTDFGKKWVQRTINDGKPTAEDAIEMAKAAKKELDDYRQQMAAREQAAEGKKRLGEYIDSHVKHITADKDAAMMRGWYDESEIPTVVESIANRHYDTTQEVLTPPNLSGMVLSELRTRLERFSKTEAGQQYLRQLLGDPSSSSGQPKPKAPATAPKTLSQDLTAHASGQAPKGRKDRKSLLEEAMRLIPQE